MKKHYTALLAAFLITMCMGAGMLLVSGSAYLNKNGLPVADSPSAATATAVYTSAQEAQLQQLQDLVNQYQTREVQYKNELAKASQQLDAANAQVQQYEMVMTALQSRGVIRIDQNGRISLP
jgi:hypothetical protein